MLKHRLYDTKQHVLPGMLQRHSQQMLRSPRGSSNRAALVQGRASVASSGKELKQTEAPAKQQGGLSNKPSGEGEDKDLKVLNIVVVGASGDLAKREIYPALFLLHQKGLLPPVTNIIGYASSESTDDEFRKKMAEALEGHEKEIDEFLKRCHYIHGPYDKDEGYEKLMERIESYETGSTKEAGDKQPKAGRLFYLSVPPKAYVNVCQYVSKFCHKYPEGSSRVSPSSWLRVVIEKPFGKDLESSDKMMDDLDKVFDEKQIFRSDHFVGTELAQNMLMLRFANMPYAAVWNREYIDFIEVVCYESMGTGGRGAYFDEYGIIRDVMQNHLLQLLTFATMEAPKSLKPDDVRDAKVQLLQCIDPIRPQQAVLGQYAQSEDGKKKGYAEDTEVDKDSKCLTYAALRLDIHNERWEGVPIIMKAGKALDQDIYAVRVVFKAPKIDLFGELDDHRTEMILKFQPDAIATKLVTRAPASMKTRVESSTLTMPYTDRYKPEELLFPYEWIISDAIDGCPEKFVRRDELRRAWEIFTPLLKAIDESGVKPEPYANGGKGPCSTEAFNKALGGWENDYDWKGKA